MSQTMNKKPPKNDPLPEAPEELSLAEQWVDKLMPYGSMIALGIALCFLAFIIVTYMIKANEVRAENEWRELNTSITEVGLSGNTARLKQVADDFPTGRAGMWALQLAGDYDLRTGIGQLSYDREGGLKLIEKSRDTLQRIVDGPASAKTTDLQRCSTFSLAYANESMGEFAKAKSLYQEIVDNALDSPFGEPAKRGLARCSNPKYAVLFDDFKTYDDSIEEAPGATVPDKPNISFPIGGGEFDGAGTDASDENPTTTDSAEEDTVEPAVQNSEDKNENESGNDSDDK